MVPQNELRIGNWIIDKKGTYAQIKSGAEIDEAANFSSIAMSDDVLTSCGFAFHPYFKLWQKARKSPQQGSDMELDKAYNVRDFGHRYIGVQLKSLHQLQNLFFQLHHEEIEMT